ncbi:MAG TPA: PIN domain-containing protein [Actinomycetota bacterium]|nr:PIN domain-containing protein [Actinomycetota bacterium]
MNGSTKSSPRSSRISSDAVVLDTSVLYADADRSDTHHVRCRRLLERTPGPLLVPTLVVGEITYLLARRHGPHAEAVFLASLAAAELLVEHPTQRDMVRIAQLVWTYKDLPLGTVDASIVALAERLKVATIATLDRLHFSVVRPRHVAAFELVP